MLTIFAEPAHPPLCVITNHPAKYRDPKTGLPYYNSYAYREIRRVYRGDYKWSRLLGAWVGRGDYAASGVPDWFLDPSKAQRTAEPVLALKDGVEELKQEEEEEQRPDEEPRLEPIERRKEVGAAEPVIPQAASTS
jgi:vacuolar protein sorting-associated protein 72